MTDQLEEVYRRHRRGLFALALSITGKRQLAEDAVHDAFMRLCRRNDTPSGSLVSYVFAAVRNAARDICRQQKTIGSDSLDLFQNSGRDTRDRPDADPARQAEQSERDDALRSAVMSLDDASREVVILKTYAGLTFDAIGDALQEPPATVATRYRRALEKLQQRLRGRL